MKIALVNHGCPKNLVDTEIMAGALTKAGYKVTLDENEAEVVVVNTCSFIHDAEVESVQSILQLAQKGKKIVVAGCLSQKYKDELKQAIPEIAAMTGTCDREGIVETIKNLKKGYAENITEPDYIYPEGIKREYLTVGSSAYLKIADGCNYQCGYCIIPHLRGKYHSRTMENIVAEAQKMIKNGISEIILIAQDTTSYGIDIYGEYKLPELLRKINAIESDFWIRIMYTYPSLVSDELLDAMKECEKTVKYIDMPLQHSHPEVLRAMKRPDFSYENLIKKIREKIPEIAIRTAFIVGYPTETEEQFEHLYNFIKKMHFDRLGVFEFSCEEGTYAATLAPKVDAKTMRKRYNKLMLLQQKLSREVNAEYVGKTVKCLIEGVRSDGVVAARTYRDAPEIDGMVYIEGKKAPNYTPGEFENVLITGSDEYDLFA